MVRHPESDDPEDHCTDLEGNPIYGPVDSDGHYIDFQVGRMGGTELAEVELRRGMAPSSAARILRKLAGLIEHNPGLMSERQGVAMLSPDEVHALQERERLKQVAGRR